MPLPRMMGRHRLGGRNSAASVVKEFVGIEQTIVGFLWKRSRTRLQAPLDGTGRIWWQQKEDRRQELNGVIAILERRLGTKLPTVKAEWSAELLGRLRQILMEVIGLRRRRCAPVLPDLCRPLQEPLNLKNLEKCGLRE